MERNDIAMAIERHRIVAVLRLSDPAALLSVITALVAGGVKAFEVTMTVPNALQAIARIASTLATDLLLGAGTVLDSQTAVRAVDAGASFIVSPVFRKTVIETCHQRGVPALPGCYTPTEILDAWEAGADIVKVFPATTLGPGYVKDLRAPLPDLKLMPTGGVTPDNAGDWIRAGAAALGIGSALLPARAIAAGDFAQIAELARRAVHSVAAAQSSATDQSSSHR